jgi:glycosyltransferase involved in cell wall biosynthesis
MKGNRIVTIKVLHLLGPLRPSGMERMLLTAAEYFHKEGISSIVVGQGPDHSYEGELRSAGYDVRTLDAVGTSAASASALRQLVRELDVDVVHIHTEGNYLRTALAARWALGRKGSIVRTVHSVFNAKGLWRLTRFLQAFVADRLLSALIVPSPDVAAIERSMRRKSQIIFNWVDDRLYSIPALRRSIGNPSDEPPLALIVGNCSTIKHHELALQAVRVANHKVIHLGDEKDASPEELALLEALEQSGQLIERGVKSPYHALSRASYFMIPSRHEGMSVALAEAIVADVPALVNDVQGLQWASQIGGVMMVHDNAPAWSKAVMDWQQGNDDGLFSAPNLSASRGAREYADVYRHAVRGKKRRSRVEEVLS